MNGNSPSGLDSEIDIIGVKPYLEEDKFGVEYQKRFPRSPSDGPKIKKESIEFEKVVEAASFYRVLTDSDKSVEEIKEMWDE